MNSIKLKWIQLNKIIAYDQTSSGRKRVNRGNSTVTIIKEKLPADFLRRKRKPKNKKLVTERLPVDLWSLL